MKKKGFTLVELLAVIVILAIILVIAVPAVGNLIQGAKGNTFTSQKKLIEKAASLYYMAYASNLTWEDDVSSITIGELKNQDFLEDVRNPLNNQVITDDTVVLVLKDNRGNMTYSLQMYDDIVMEWYKNRMIEAFKEGKYTLPTVTGETNIVNLDELITSKRVDELRLPLDLTSRCAGYVEVAKTTNDYEYNAYVDCLTNASTFASHYVSYGGKYLDRFSDVKQTSDGGFIAVGDSNSDVITKYGNQSKGKYDAIIAKFKADGTVEWSHNFGGSNADYFYAVDVTTDGYVAVGGSSSTDYDLTGIYKGGTSDGIIVKYNLTGDIVYKRSYGSSGTAGTEDFRDIIKVNDGYVLVGGMDNVAKDGDLADYATTSSADICMIIKFDNNFNQIWRSFFGGNGYERFISVLQTSDGGYLVSGTGSSNNLDLAGLNKGSNDGYIVKYDGTGTVQYKQSFGGTGTEGISGLAEVSDGYLIVGNSSSSDIDMVGLNKATNKTNDAVIVKYNKTLSNILWIKSFGGTSDDVFRGIVTNGSSDLFVVGYSKSTDMDMNGIAISTGGYNNSIFINYDGNGNIKGKKIFGGTNSDSFNAIIKTADNRYVLAGETYSSDINLKNFNKGHSDATLVSYDNSFNLTKVFQEPVIIIDKLKTIVPNYGTTLSLNYANIYTSNNPEIDLGNWCTTQSNYGFEYNYKYGQCLYPFNKDELKLLTNIETTSSEKLKRVYQGENEYPLDIQADNKTSWHRLHFRLINSGTIEISNFKLKFENGSIYSIEDAISNKYIEPLVVVSNIIAYPPYSDNVFPHPLNIIYTGGNPGPSSYPDMYVYFKPNNYRLTSVIFTSSVNISSSVGFSIEELRNFDMSISKTE